MGQLDMSKGPKMYHSPSLEQALPIECNQYMDNAGLPETRTWQVETRHRDAGRWAGIENGRPRFRPA